MALTEDSTAKKKSRQGKRKAVIYHAPVLAERDGGWYCHYCGSKLVPFDVPINEAPYYQLKMTRSCHPSTLGDCDGRYTYEESMHACDLASRGLLMFWIIDWTLADGYRHAVVDHMTPVSKGGSNDLDNLVLACWECNCKKAAKPYDVFMRQINGGAS